MKKILFILCLILAGCSSPSRTISPALINNGVIKTTSDRYSERTILMTHPASGEYVKTRYFYNGRYDPVGLNAINILFRDRHAKMVGQIDPALIDFLVDMRERMGLPDTAIFEILNGYRSESTNQWLGNSNNQVAKESLHKYGLAVDFRVRGVWGQAMAEIAKTMQRGGVAFYPSDNHIHLDLGNIRTWKTR